MHMRAEKTAMRFLGWTLKRVLSTTSPKGSILEGFEQILTRPTGEQCSPVPRRLLDVLQLAAAERGHYVETIRAYVDGTTRFILFHDKWYARELTNGEVGHFLGHVPSAEKDPFLAIKAARTTGDGPARPATLPRKSFGNRSLGNERCHPIARTKVLPGHRGRFT